MKVIQIDHMGSALVALTDAGDIYHLKVDWNFKNKQETPTYTWEKIPSPDAPETNP